MDAEKILATYFVEEPKPCPFCGETLHRFRNVSGEIIAEEVYEHDINDLCFLSGIIVEESQIQNWNKRCE